MHTPLALLNLVAKAALKHVNFGGGPDGVIDVLPEVAREIWEEWAANRNPDQLRKEVELLAQMPFDELRREAAAVAEEVAANRSPEVRQALASFLVQLPGSIRQSLRRPGDPSGRTAPPNLSLRNADDLLPFLPARLPRFQPGSRPLPGVDWELTDLLGVGGFGEVWKARNPLFDGVAPVALKFCLDETAKERLLKHEASVLNQVMRQGSHPGIVKLCHTYLSADPPCLEYEYVEGGDLSGLIQAWHRAPVFSAQGGRVNPVIAQATKVLRELAEVVAFAHSLNPSIVHRDLKPANILLQRGKEGRLTPRVADFGIGGVASRQAIQRTQRSSSGGAFLTSALRGSHTPLYASPQQMRGDPADARDDVHALGVIWYQMLVGDMSKGRPAGRGWRKNLTEKGMGAELLDLLESCVDDDLEYRPRDAGVLVERLKKLVEKPAAPPPPPPPPPKLQIPKVDLPAARPVERIPPPPPLPPAARRAVPPPPIPPLEVKPIHRAVAEQLPDVIPVATRMVIVSRLGRGQYTSVAAAVRAAVPGTQIRVQPGTYNESLVLDKQLEIVGDGPASEIIVQSTEATVLYMKTDYAVVRGMTLRCLAGTKGKTTCSAVDIPQGQLVLEECFITSDSSACIAVHGATADPIIRRCKIYDGKQTGVFLYEGAAGRIEDCEIWNNTLAGVEIKQGAHPLVRRCKVHDGKQTGFFILDNGQGVIEDCDIFGNTLGGIEVKQRSAPVVRRCQLHDGKQTGMFIWDNALGTVEDCDIWGNALAGLEIKQGADPMVRRCKLRDGKAGGVFVWENGVGTIEDCDFFGNALSAVEIKQGANPLIRRCKMHGGKQTGCFIQDRGRGTIEDCDIWGNALACVEIKLGGNPVVRRCKLHEGQAGGFFVWDGGTGTIEDCEVWGNKLSAVEIKQTGNPVLRRCQLRDGKAGGLYAHDRGQGTIEDCVISGNALTGVEIKQAASPVIRRCRINQNGYQAVYVHDKGAGAVEYCDVTGNKHGPWNIESGCQVRRGGNKE